MKSENFSGCSVRYKPYGMLYVYVIDGPVPLAAQRFGDDLLGVWEDAGTSLLIFESPREPEVLDFLSDLPFSKYLYEAPIDYSDWEAGKPVIATHVAGFLVCPTWDVKKPEPWEKRILLDPGLAFGTGLHPTTQNCLAILRQLFEQHKPKRVLDLGCGSGVLSIAAALCGAESVVSVDNTPIAAESARRSVAANGLDSIITVIEGDAFSNLHHEADLIICNIFYSVIVKLLEAPDFTGKEWSLISGVHTEKLHDQIVPMIEGAGRTIVQTYTRTHWYTYLTKR